MRVRPFFVRLRDFLLRKPFYRDGWRSYACKTKPATVKTVAPINTQSQASAEARKISHKANVHTAMTIVTVAVICVTRVRISYVMLAWISVSMLCCVSCVS
mgnify:CR=1 FL=1